MGTAVEKIFSRKAGRTVHSGEIVTVEVDCYMMHDLNGPVALDYFDQFHEKVKSPERGLISLCHLSPAPTAGAADHHKRLRDFAKAAGMDLIDTGKGVCHPAVIESGKVFPGCVAVGTDSHSAHYGALNCFSTAMGASEIAVIMATDKTWFRVPRTICIELNGRPKGYVCAKDIALEILRRLGETGALYTCLEFTGSTFEYLSVDERSVIGNLMIETGAKGAIMPYDRILEQWLSLRGIGYDPSLAVTADPDAVYEKKISINVAELEPLVAVPPTMNEAVPVKSLDRIQVDQVVIGSCTNGNYGDFEIAASVLKGKKVHEGVRLLIIPSLESTALKMAETGIYKDLLDAGAVIIPPSCGPCAEMHCGLLGAGETAFATTNRNMAGRMGSRMAQVYIGSPATAAFTAVSGFITVGGA